MQDMTIVGAGLVGKSLTLALAHFGYSISLLENHLENSRANHSQDRPISLSYASVQILKTLQIWPFLQDSAVPILEVHVSEASRFGTLNFRASDLKVDALGQVVSFAQLQEALFQKITEFPNIQLIEIDTIQSIALEKDVVGINYDKNGHFTLISKLLLGADGTASETRQRLNISVQEKANQSLAVLARLKIKGEHQNRAYERFTEMGTLALLPLFSRDEYRLVWTLPESDFLRLSSDEIIHAVKKNFKNRVEIVDFNLEGKFPLKTVIADEMNKGRAAILGNAAHTFHPIAAQGFNLSLWEVAVLAEILSENKFLDGSVLEEFAKQVSSNQSRTIDLTDHISRIFDIPFIGNLRGLGLFATEFLSPIKNRLARQLMGTAGKVPKLARGRILTAGVDR